MKLSLKLKELWMLWFVAAGLFVALALYPVSYQSTRLASLALGLAAWMGFILLLWRRRLARWSLLGFTLLVVGFLCLPARNHPDPEALRDAYVVALQRYEKVRYHWGGETVRGIDCSGLIRRGWGDALLVRGFRTLDPGLVRAAISLWWNDCTASALGKGHQGLTRPVVEAPSLNSLPSDAAVTSRLRPGDLAVTASGLHILAYLGDHRWIQADPYEGEVITLPAPAENNWYGTPVRIVRWRALE